MKHRLLLPLLLSTFLAVPATTHAAKAQTAWSACPDDDSATPVFAAYGDDADYTPAPGGLFDQSLQWTATGSATLATGANPFAAGADDTTSAALNKGDTITSPPFCVTRHNPFARYAARSIDPKSHLALSVVYVDEHGKSKVESLGDLDGNHFRSWSLTDKVKLDKCLPKDETLRSIQLRFTVRDGDGGGWMVDNVFVDPFKRG